MYCNNESESCKSFSVDIATIKERLDWIHKNTIENHHNVAQISDRLIRVETTIDKISLQENNKLKVSNNRITFWIGVVTIIISLASIPYFSK